MPIRQKQYPVRFTPRGLVDAFDATDKFPGACVELSNLVFDTSNPEIMVSRPGVTSIDFAGTFPSPGFVSVHQTIGDYIYGMIATATNAGHDEPFVYNHALSSFVAITGVTAANTPTSPETVGAWVPPTIAAIGRYLIFTHPGFPGGATKFGVLDLLNPAIPVWTATDTATNNLPSVPLAVSNFNNRAYFACTNTAAYTDVLDPLTRTSGTQALTIGDKSNIVAFNGLPIQTTSSGIIQALVVFKGFQVWQITGDSVGGTLALNFMSLTTGTLAPRSVQQSPLGVYFAANSGPMVIDFFGILRNVTNSPQQQEPDIYTPWQNFIEPSRVSAAYSADVYRISMQTVVLGAIVTNDYWFHEKRRRWTGPHTFTYDCASQHDDHFILSTADLPGKLFHSFSFPKITSVYTDDGVSIMSTLKSSTFPKTGHMVGKQVVESTQELSSAGSVTSFVITALDETGNTLNSTDIPTLPVGALWGSAIWGAFSWASSVNIPKTYTVPWTNTLVFKKMAIFLQATAQTALAFGTFFARYQETGYTNTP
jgi:hypothetical protein